MYKNLLSTPPGYGGHVRVKFRLATTFSVITVHPLELCCYPLHLLYVTVGVTRPVAVQL